MFWKDAKIVDHRFSVMSTRKTFGFRGFNFESQLFRLQNFRIYPKIWCLNLEPQYRLNYSSPIFLRSKEDKQGLHFDV